MDFFDSQQLYVVEGVHKGVDLMRDECFINFSNDCYTNGRSVIIIRKKN